MKLLKALATAVILGYIPTAASQREVLSSSGSARRGRLTRNLFSNNGTNITSNMFDPAGAVTQGKTVIDKAQPKANDSKFLVCYRDSTSATIFAVTDDDDEPNAAFKTVRIPFAYIKVENGESLIIDASVSSVFVTFQQIISNFRGNLDFQVLVMSVLLFPGCTSEATCVGVTPITPEPAASLKLNVDGVSAFNPDGSSATPETVFQYTFNAATHTGRFYFPSLAAGNYFLSIQFDLYVLVGLAHDDDYYSFEGASASLGPHLITAERVRASNSACVSDDYDDTVDDDFIGVPFTP